MDLAYADAVLRAITLVESSHEQFEAALENFIAVAVAAGWSADQIDAELQSWGYCLEPTEPAPAGQACH